MDLMDGRFDGVREWARKALAIDPTYGSAMKDVVTSDLAQRHWTQWKADLARWQQLGQPKDPLSDSVADAIEAGRLAEARRLVHRMGSAADPYIHSTGELAGLFIATGDHDAAFAELESGYANRSYEMLYLDRDPRIAELRNDPRLLSLRRRMGLAN